MLKRKSLAVNPLFLYEGLIADDFQELPVTSKHALALTQLQDIHNDPFDRILLAQALEEGFTLITRDTKILKYDANTIKG